MIGMQDALHGNAPREDHENKSRCCARSHGEARPEGFCRDEKVVANSHVRSEAFRQCTPLHGGNMERVAWRSLAQPSVA